MNSELYASQKMITMLIITVLYVIVGCSSSQESFFSSPYEAINWEGIGHYDAQFHVHPGLGNEEYDPHKTIDRYHEEGFKILALSPHDYDIPDLYIESLYPWTQLSDIYEIIKNVENPTEDDMIYEEIANEIYENRNPVELDMISIEGCELSGPHHMVNLFNSFTDGASTEEESFQILEDKGGIAYFAHPGRYVERWDLTEEWYVEHYNNFDALIGQAIYNRRDTHPEDRAFYDKIVHVLGVERPIWLFGEDDTHHEGNIAWNRNVVLLESFIPGSLHPDIQDGSAPHVKEALINGYTYLWKPSEQYNRRAFDIVNVIVAENEVQLTVDNEELVDEVRWVTHNPTESNTETIHTGYRISESDVPEYSKFVRVEIEGKEGTIYTQPFYINNR